MKFLDLFAGIGGFRLGMEMAGHECVGFVEWDKHARKSYEAIHNTEGEWTAYDITKVTDDELRELKGKGIDIICGGFPCQSFSIAGNRRGFEDTRGTLFFEIARFAKELQPKYLFLENVQGILNHKGGETFEIILKTLDELGYDADWQLCNSRHFGLSHNRERTFIIGLLRGSSAKSILPIRGFSQTDNSRRERIKNDQVLPTINIKEATKKGYATALVGDSINFEFPNSKTRRGRVGKGVAQTLTTSCNQAVLTKDGRLRRLTPRECWRLQGFLDSAFDKAREVNSDAQLYKQAGNGVSVNVIYEIAKKLK